MLFALMVGENDGREPLNGEFLRQLVVLGLLLCRKLGLAREVDL